MIYRADFDETKKRIERGCQGLSIGAKIIKELDPSIEGLTRIELFKDPLGLKDLYDDIDLYTLKSNSLLGYLQSIFRRNKTH